MNIQTATVETLTADVHVVKTNSRQVTLGVARQLDRLQLGRHWTCEFEPFGRVRTIPGAEAKRWIEFIGRRTDDGALAMFVANVNNLAEAKVVDPEEFETMQDWLDRLPLIVLAR